MGYARVSTKEQSLDLQMDALEKAGCEQIYSDHLSANKAQRPGLTEAQSPLRQGDVLVVWKLDRLGRSVKRLIELVDNLAEHRIKFLKII